MVRCMWNGRVYETCVEEKEMEEVTAETKDVTTEMEALQIEEEPEEMELEAAADGRLAGEYHEGVLRSGVKCMMNGVIYYPGVKNVLEAETLREMAAVARNTLIIKDHFDGLGHPRVKIVYVNCGDLTSARRKTDFEVNSYIKAITKAEKEREEKKGLAMPRLIFVIQDKDYWPGSEKDPEVMARRAAKEQRVRGRCRYVVPDEKMIRVNPLPEREMLVCPPISHTQARLAYSKKIERLDFLAYFDPSLPGTKFVLENVTKLCRDAAIESYMEDPDLYKEWLRISETEAPGH